MISHITPSLVLMAAILVLLVVGGTLRLTRLVTTDSLGGWMLRDAAQAWADRHESAKRDKLGAAVREATGSGDPVRQLVTAQDIERLRGDDPISWQGRLVSGLYCPFCVGFWIGVAVVVLTIVLTPLAPVGLVWVAILALLTLNYITGHISSRID